MSKIFRCVWKENIKRNIGTNTIKQEMVNKDGVADKLIIERTITIKACKTEEPPIARTYNKNEGWQKFPKKILICRKTKLDLRDSWRNKFKKPGAIEGKVQ